jgi:hypothetical protein
VHFDDVGSRLLATGPSPELHYFNDSFTAEAANSRGPTTPSARWTSRSPATRRPSSPVLRQGEETHAYGTGRASPAVQEHRAEVRVDASTIAEEACENPPCEWRAHVNPNVAVDSAFELRVSVFPHHPPPEANAAFDE